MASVAVPNTDRIYVGGFDPLLGLTVSDVLQRLEARATTEGLAVTDLHQGRCYVQFDATVTSNHQPSKTPLETIKSWFHNVTWKGCKLVVQKARPHLLQRLLEEREFTQQFTLPPTACLSIDSTSDKPLPPVKRHWKVKRGYCGEAVRLVDTQPCEVDDWAMLSRIKKRHAAQQEKDRQQKRSVSSKKEQTIMQQLDSALRLRHAQKQSYYNRSIHLRFTEELKTTSGTHLRETLPLNVSSVVDSSDDEHDESNDDNSHAKHATPKYAWSDDDDDDDDSKEQESVDDGRYETVPVDLGLDATVFQPGTSSSVHSDDESFDNEASTQNKKRLTESNVNELDEFAAAMDTSNGVSFVDDIESGDEDSLEGDTQKGSETLHDDVETNLKVFAQLFPEYSEQRTARAAQEQEIMSSKTQTDTKLSSSGWGAMGQMLRFDPTKAQAAAQFVLDPDDDETASQEEAVVEKENPTTVDASDSPLKVTVESESPPEKVVQLLKSVIYEQDKLELVFKEAREPMSQVSTETGLSGFSFGFDLAPTKAVNSSISGAFAFSFSGSEVSGTDATNTEGVDKAMTCESANDLSGVDCQLPSRTGFCPRAFSFPSESELDTYVQNFYHRNDGARIIRDLDGWRNDPEVKERWMKERLALTQDWKRKRKYALSKKQKRFR